MLRLERAGGAHDVSAESEPRSSFGREDVSLNGVGEIEPSIQVLVHLEIQIVVLMPQIGIVVRLRKEPRGPQDDARKTLRPVEQLTKLLGGFLGYPVDVLRSSVDVLVDPGGRFPVGRSQRGSKGTRRAAIDDSRDAAPKRSLENSKCSCDVGLDKGMPRVRRQVRLVERGGVDDDIDPAKAPPDEVVI
jgi:hypothetical protein